MIERGLFEAYQAAAIRAQKAINSGEFAEQPTAQMLAVVRIRKAAREILDEMGVPDIELTYRFGDVLKDTREKLGMKKKQLAAILGVDASAAGRYESRYTFMSVDKLNRLIEVIGDRISEDDKQRLFDAHLNQKAI